MKYIKISLLLLFSAGVFASCTDWFDAKPRTEVRGVDLFKTEEGFWEALTGVYLNMAHQEAYGANLSWRAIEFMAWQHRSPSNGDYDDLQLNRYDIQSAIKFIDRTWARLYNVITEANYLIYALENYGNYLNPVVYNNIMAQALAIRAYCHFDLIRLYAQGNLAAQPELLDRMCIPYVEKYSKIITDQRDYGWTLDRLMEDVTAALELFDDSNVLEEDRVEMRRTNMNPFSTMLLAARVEMWRGNKDATMEYIEPLLTAIENGTTNRLVGTKLDLYGSRETYSGLRWARDAGEGDMFPNEIIFGISLFNLYDLTVDSWKVLTRDRLLSVTPTSGDNGLYLISAQEPNISSAASDLRYSNWYKNSPASNEDDSGFESIKIQRGGNLTPEVENTMYNIISLMRMSEPYLLAAECLVDTDPGRAIGLVNTLREKRTIPETHYVQSDISTEDLRKVIMYEQVREFAQEGQAFFLYKRLNTPKMINQQKNALMNVNTYTLPYPQNEQLIGHTNEEEEEE